MVAGRSGLRPSPSATGHIVTCFILLPSQLHCLSQPRTQIYKTGHSFFSVTMSRGLKLALKNQEPRREGQTQLYSARTLSCGQASSDTEGVALLQPPRVPLNGSPQGLISGAALSKCSREPSGSSGQTRPCPPSPGPSCSLVCPERDGQLLQHVHL